MTVAIPLSTPDAQQKALPAASEAEEKGFRSFLEHVLEDPSMPEDVKAQIAGGLRKRFDNPPLAALEQSLRCNMTKEKVRPRAMHGDTHFSSKASH